MRCEDAQSRFPELLGGERPEGEADTRAHIEACPACQREWEGSQQLWQALSQAPLSEAPPPPPAAIGADLHAGARARRVRPLLLAAVVGVAGVYLLIKGAHGDPTLPMLAWAAALAALGLVSAAYGLRLGGVEPRRGGLLLVGGAGLFVGASLTAPLLFAQGWQKLACVGDILEISGVGLVLLSVGLWGARLPTALSGALLGAGTGLVAGAALHLHCGLHSIAHSLFVHGAGVTLSAAAGALIAWRLSKRALHQGGG